MARVLIIGAGGVGSVVAHKCAQNPEVFTEIMLASRTVSKCDAIAASIKERTGRIIETARVNADDVPELVALIKRYKPVMVINVALPYQDLTIMDACLEAGVHYMDTANYEPLDVAKFEYKWQWAYQQKFKDAGLMALLGSGFDPGVTNVFESLEGGTYDFQSLEIANPNVIFCAPGLKEQIESDSRFADFQAVQQGNVVEMDESLMEWQGRTIVETAYEISAAAFPQLLESSSSVSDPTQDIESQVSSALEAQAQYETLEQGDQGDSVQTLQERLTQLGYLTDPYDGMYGSTTADCVSRFQTANGLEATGIADPATQAALFTSGALREDGTPLPEESGESSTSQSSSSTSESSSSASESSASESSSQASSASSASESSSQTSASQ